MHKSIKTMIAFLLIFTIGITGTILYLPTNRVKIDSELLMLGDLNNDNQWDELDINELSSILQNPFMKNRLLQYKVDINQNGLFDNEDISFLKHLCNYKNPYLAQEKLQNIIFPQPRELYRYLPKYEYVQQPLFSIKHDIIHKSPFSFLESIKNQNESSYYSAEIFKEIYNEAIRFTFALEMRKNELTDIEHDYVEHKIQVCEELFQEKQYYRLLLSLIGLVEDAETLSLSSQPKFIQKILYFRDSLKDLLVSKQYEDFENGTSDYLTIFKIIESHLESDLNISIKLDTLPSARDFTDLENYLDRAEWQVYKSNTSKEDFEKLVLYAQYDKRYLRAVSRTSPKHQDIQLNNHNLPMILLFRESLRITKNKKAALGLLDEAVRIPMGWVKNIPKDMLPSSIALENFLLPGNKEDGSDKTRHWSVFGGVSIYKNPKESLILALKRENQDLKANGYSAKAMNEFIRDTIANVNGVYYVVSINPNLLFEIKQKPIKE